MKHVGTLDTANQEGDILHLDLVYPNIADDPSVGRIRKIQIGLMDVRAADDIRISYDFERDGWKIEQEKINTNQGHYTGTGEWVEVAFIEAWANETEIE
jgi:hypothetical protein